MLVLKCALKVKEKPMKGLMAVTAALAFVVIVNWVVAADPPDPTGTWTWRYPNQSAEHTLKLKLEGDKLTGSIRNYARGPESPLEDATYDHGVVSFKQTYVGRGNDAKSVATYRGRVSGDTIKGTVEFKHPDRTLSRDWEAARSK